MTDQLHVVIGAGPVGWTTAERLADAGHRVRVVTRSGSGPDHLERVRADATDAAAMTAAIDGAAAFYNCVNPPYTRWDTDWPPVHRSLMRAATVTGAVYVLMDNLYAYGPNGGAVMRESDPLRATGTKGRTRAEMATELLTAHQEGRLRATIARASDFAGPRVIDAALGERVLPRVLAGKSVKVLGSADVPHSVTYMPDVARTLVTLGTDERAWGAAWHVPSAPAVSQREYVTALADAAGTDVRVGTIPYAALWALGLVVPMMRGLRETWYQFAEPFVMDSSAAESTFGITPTPLAQQASETVAWWREASHLAA
jgi:nucleoside-diphosphate-sugar epimerase